jgi:putative oxidoreductase
MESFGPAVLRTVVGAVFVAHGMQTLFGAFGGVGLSGTAGFFEGLRFPPAFPLAVGIGTAEFAGGLMLIAGAFTRLAAAMLVATMLGAIWTVHAQNGFFLNWTMTPGSGHGVEYSLVLVGALVCLALTGPGELSFDRRRALSAEADALGRARLRRKL